MRLIDADALKINIVEEGQRSRRYKLGEIWELNKDEIYKVIDEQPTIEPEPRWIPCSRELPDTREFTSKTVLCCDKYGGIYTATYDKQGEWRDDVEYAVLMDVIAWMPTPEPYKEGQE